MERYVTRDRLAVSAADTPRHDDARPTGLVDASGREILRIEERVPCGIVGTGKTGGGET